MNKNESQRIYNAIHWQLLDPSCREKMQLVMLCLLMLGKVSETEDTSYANGNGIALNIKRSAIDVTMAAIHEMGHWLSYKLLSKEDFEEIESIFLKEMKAAGLTKPSKVENYLMEHGLVNAQHRALTCSPISDGLCIANKMEITGVYCHEKGYGKKHLSYELVAEAMAHYAMGHTKWERIMKEDFPLTLRLLREVTFYLLKNAEKPFKK